MLGLASLACRIAAPGKTDQTSGAVLFQDSFSNNRSGWNQVTTADGVSNYADGMYRIFVNRPNMDIWARPSLSFKNVSVEVDALKVAGDRNNRFGVLCRLTQSDSFYAFVISSDGYYGIAKIKGQDYQLLGMDAMQPSDLILQGAALNHIRADCVDDVLTFYINGKKAGEAKDSEFQTGDVGLIAGSYETAGTDILFDSFSVKKP